MKRIVLGLVVAAAAILGSTQQAQAQRYYRPGVRVNIGPAYPYRPYYAYRPYYGPAYYPPPPPAYYYPPVYGPPVIAPSISFGFR